MRERPRRERPNRFHTKNKPRRSSPRPPKPFKRPQIDKQIKPGKSLFINVVDIKEYMVMGKIGNAFYAVAFNQNFN